MVIDGLACAALILVAVEDIRRFRIRNGLIFVLIALFGFSAWWSGDVDGALWHGAFALVALVAMFGAFVLGLVGAGDAKLLAVACLWVGPEMALPFTLILFALTVLYGIGAKSAVLPARRAEGKTKIPFGPSIAAAWIATIVLR